MRLKRLEIFGFKSFAKKLDLKLVGGISAIVGPNGCGKTNVVDAIRWVLGEQRPTQIRLERMEDVLFKGSASRRHLGMAEVSLTIENDSRILALDMPEITISRRLFRSGESDYLINKKACRLSDINDLFMDTGMGTDSYSMFEQHMINSILSDKAEDRRHIFEEAAGVTKYKVRRKSALGKLASIEDDLERVSDIIVELERRVGSLKRQASKAERYRKLKTDIKDRTIALAAFEIKQLSEEIDTAYRKIDAMKDSSESLMSKSANLTAENERLSLDIVTVEKERAANAGSFSSNLARMSEKEKEAARLGSQIDYLEKKAGHDREESKRSAEEIEKLAENRGVAENNVEKAISRLEQIEDTYNSLIDEHRAFEAGVLEKREARNAVEQNYFRIEREQAEQRASLEAVHVWGEKGESRLNEIIERVGEIESTITEMGNELKSIHSTLKLLAEKEQGITENISDLKDTFDGRTLMLEELDTCIRLLREEEAPLKAERDFLAEVVKTYEGYSEGVRNAVGSEKLRGRILGVLGDLVSTEDTYVGAIEAALEEKLQNIFVTTKEDALAGIRHLKEKKKGRATFLPLDSPDTTDGPPLIPGGKGIIGPACEFIKTEERFRPAVNKLLENVVIVDTIETALEMQQRFSNLIYVTLDGEKAGACGELEGGRVCDESGRSVIGRVEQLEKLEAELKEAESEIVMLVERRGILTDEIGQLRVSVDELEAGIESIRYERQELITQEAQAQAKHDAAIEMLANWMSEGERIKNSFDGYKNEKDALERNITAKGEELVDIHEQLMIVSEELKALESELERQRSHVNEYSVEKASLTEKKASLERELKVIDERCENLGQSSTRMAEDMKSTEREMIEAGLALSTVKMELDDLSAKHEGIQELKDDIENRHAQLASRRSEVEHNLQVLRRDSAEISQKRSELILKKDQTAMRIESIIERLEHEFFVKAQDISLKDVASDFEPEEEKHFLEDLRRKLQNIGDVNMAAENDYRMEKKRLDFLNSGREDLIQARDAIVATITKINRIARRRFTETFELIRSNFQKTFNDFFEGGVCDLTMEEDADPLESKILISARPPGKNVRSINLLSSGERALTAISLLFAIYRVKPSPFCILDEIDAPLDDANIDRFLHVIKRFSETTQFIMVTHNKKTMAAANNLFGITMAEPGLSNLVSVRLSNVDMRVEKETGEEEKEVSVE